MARGHIYLVATDLVLVTTTEAKRQEVLLKFYYYMGCTGNLRKTDYHVRVQRAYTSDGGTEMQKRRFGRTGHLSSVAIFGAAAFWQVSQAQAEAAMEMILQAGVNHIDVAPSYGQAEERVGPWLKNHRQDFFLGCKTQERSKEAAAAELRRSLKRLQTEQFDLFQLHAINSFEELDKVTQRGGALEAVVEAREQGLTRFIGITGHGFQSPLIFLEALRRFDFDSVLFPLNFVQYANPEYRKNAEELLHQCRARDLGSMVIKSICRSPWGNLPQTHTTWYRPFTEAADIQAAVNFALSQDVTGLCTAGDLTVLPLVLQACELYNQLSAAEQETLIEQSSQYEPLFT
jgi:predicted aldo/keto reductase-like oxidoreductase